MGPSNSSLLSFRVIFHFHDFWRKDNWVIYHLESRWRNSHVLVYHSPLLSHLLGVAPSTFTTVYIIRSTKHTSKKKHKTLHKERCFVRNLPFKLPMFGYLWDSQADGVSENSSPSWYPAETYSSHLKMDDWVASFLFGMAYFQVLC